jgi:hypothetical protein
VPRASCGGVAGCWREEAEGRRFASGQWPGGGVRRPSAVGGREGGGVRQLREGGVRRREGRGRRAGAACGTCGGLGGREEWGDAVRVSQ